MNSFVMVGLVVCTIMIVYGLFGGGLCCIGVGFLGVMGIAPLSKIGKRRY